MKFKDLLNKLYGRILTIGVTDEEFLDSLENNELVLSLDSLSQNIINYKSSFSINNDMFYIEDLTKKYKNKTINFIIVDYQQIKNYINLFITDSIKIANDIIYIYNFKDNFELLDVDKKYLRYKTINKIDEENKILEVNTNNVNVNIFKKYFYNKTDDLRKFIKDTTGF